MIFCNGVLCFLIKLNEYFLRNLFTLCIKDICEGKTSYE